MTNFAQFFMRYKKSSLCAGTPRQPAYPVYIFALGVALGLLVSLQLAGSLTKWPVEAIGQSVPTVRKTVPLFYAGDVRRCLFYRSASGVAPVAG